MFRLTAAEERKMHRWNTAAVTRMRCFDCECLAYSGWSWGHIAERRNRRRTTVAQGSVRYWETRPYCLQFDGLMGWRSEVKYHGWIFWSQSQSGYRRERILSLGGILRVWVYVCRAGALDQKWWCQETTARTPNLGMAWHDTILTTRHLMRRDYQRR